MLNEISNISSRRKPQSCAKRPRKFCGHNVCKFCDSCMQTFHSLNASISVATVKTNYAKKNLLLLPNKPCRYINLSWEITSPAGSVRTRSSIAFLTFQCNVTSEFCCCPFISLIFANGSS